MSNLYPIKSPSEGVLALCGRQTRPCNHLLNSIRWYHLKENCTLNSKYFRHLHKNTTTVVTSSPLSSQSNYHLAPLLAESIYSAIVFTLQLTHTLVRCVHANSRPMLRKLQQNQHLVITPYCNVNLRQIDFVMTMKFLKFNLELSARSSSHIINSGIETKGPTEMEGSRNSALV